MNKNIVIRQIQVKDVMTKSNAPIEDIASTPMSDAPMAADTAMPHL